MTDVDPYTIELRLCDDDGMVSHNFPGDPEHGSYLDRLNYLRAKTGLRDDHLPVKDPFPCTGHAHLAGHHVRCTSPAHQRQQTAVVNNVVVNNVGPIVGYRVGEEIYHPDDVQVIRATVSGDPPEGTSSL